jgi:HEAT repeat protein
MRIVLLLLTAALPAAAQPKKLVNAQLDTRSASAGLESVFRQLMTAQPQPAWIAYTVPAARGRQFGCDSYWRDGEFTVAGGTVHLEPPSEALVLYRVEANQVGKIRTLAPDCDIDAGGVPVHWMTDVRPAESVALLATFVTGLDRSAISAIGLHADPAADAALDKFVAPEQPESVRQKAVFWLRSFGALKRVLTNDPMIATARNDRSPRVRGQALFALSRQAGMKAVGPIQQAIENDPEREVKRRAVSALQQLPNGEGIPLLIQLAKTSHNAEVRKQAMSSLAQSRDQRAVAFFEEVLKSKQ